MAACEDLTRVLPFKGILPDGLVTVIDVNGSQGRRRN